MKKRVKPAKKQRRIGDLQEAAFVDLLRTTDLLSRGLAGVLKGEGLSSTQYNVLRILRGAPGGLPCGEIARRMITRDPDITRLLDRLEKRSLISRCREAANRRTVMVRITPRGLRLLQRLNRPVRAAHRRQLAHMGRRRLLVLSELLEAVRGESGEVGGV
jgi:DNA-binding MarR family transcriptional regulator